MSMFRAGIRRKMHIPIQLQSYNVKVKFAGSHLYGRVGVMWCHSSYVCMHVSSHYAICAWPETVN